jgi:5'(3')-deoxyribonucleotidase
MITQIFLDLDGVIIDYCGAVIKHFDLGITEADLTEYGTVERVYMEKTGDSRGKFWQGQGEDFWLNLPMLPWAKDMLELLKPYKPVILTAPTLNNAGWRQRWIMKYMPDYFQDKRYLIGPAKWSVAHPGAMLIDDKPKNIDEFNQAGGLGFTFPQPWNVGRAALCRNRFIWFKEAFGIVEETMGIQRKE